MFGSKTKESKRTPSPTRYGWELHGENLRQLISLIDSEEKRLKSSGYLDPVAMKLARKSLDRIREFIAYSM